MTDSGPEEFLPRTVADRYQIGSRLREEPWGGVWLSRDLVLDEEVGLKLCLKEAPEADAARQGFRQEARLALKLRHPHLLGVFHFGQDEDFLYLVQEAFAGESLMEKLARHQHFSLPQVLGILEQAAQALAQAHEQGLAHQSFNPLQVLVLGEEVRVANFTFPALEDEEVWHLELKAYLPPEVLRGEAPTPAGNIFSLGVLGFRLAAGSLPYPLTFDEPFPYRLETPPVDLEEVPLSLQNLLLRCLSLEPEDRFPDARAFLNQLRQLREQWRQEPWEAGKLRALGPAAARASELWGRLREGLGPQAQRLREELASLWPRLRPQTPRLWWGLGLAALMVLLLVVYYRLPRETLQPPPAGVPPAMVVPPATAPVGGGPPLLEAQEPTEAPQVAKPPVAKPPVPPPGEVKAPPREERYLIIAATYANPEPARIMSRHLQNLDFQAHVVKKTVGGKAQYQVQVGPVTGSKPAEEVARRLQAERLNPTVQKLTPPPARPSSIRRPAA